ncbi:MAG: LemA family protein [Bacteroidota bacterium]
MTTSTIVLLVAAVLIVLIIVWLISVYNELTKERILVNEGFSGTGATLQKRNDLIPNLVETVKGYAGHENKTLVEVIKWRNQSAGATTIAEQNAASAGLNKALINMLQITENYPELKANQNFLQLQGKLNELEEEIAYARRYYNGTVREYNQSMAVFPKNIVAGMFGFKPETFFAEDAAARTAPTVSFS